MWPETESSGAVATDAGHVLRAMETVPVCLQSLANDLNARLVATPLEPELQCYVATRNDGFLICVNANHSSNRQRFSAAHAIGHLVLDRARILRGGGCNDGLDYRSSSKFPHFNPEIGIAEDKQANNFAVSLLMPEKKVRELYQLAPDNIPGIARFIGVSTEALSLRLASLLRKDHLGLGPGDLGDKDGGSAALQELPL